MSDDDLLQSVEIDWTRRARAAADGAAALRSACAAVGAVAAANHFGDCTEGVGMQTALVPALRNWQAQLTAQAAHLERLARACAAAHSTFAATDGDLGRDLTVQD